MKRYRFRFFQFGRSRRNQPVRGTSVLFKRYSSFEGLELRSMLSGNSLQDDSALIGTLNEQDVHESPIDRLSIAKFMASNLAASPLAATDDSNSNDPPSAEPLVDTFKAKVTVVLEDLQGNVIDEIVAGQQFKIKVFVTDTRTDPDLQGVAGAYVEVNYNSSLFNLDANSLVVAPDFTDLFESKDTATAGKIAAGGQWLETNPNNLPDAGEAQLLWSATLTATGSGTASFTTAFHSFSNDTELFMFGEDTASDPTTFDFQSADLAVVSQPTISIDNVSKSETNANQNYVFTVSLSSAAGTTVLVPWTTSDGTGNTGATAGSDYVAQSGTLTFGPNATQALITIAVNGDSTPEEDETFNVTLSPPASVTAGDVTGLGTILDDDTSRISIADVSADETDGTTTMVFAVSISKASAEQVLVTYTTQDGTATVANNDYTSKTGTLTFAAGSTSQQFITITINGDEVQEENETFKVVLSNPTNGAALTKAEGIGTINNDDGPELSISPPTVTHPEGDADSQLVFTVTLANPNTQTTTVLYNTANGTATAGSDYTAKSGTLTFAAGTTQQLITIDITGDNVDELDETFSVVLSGAENALVKVGTSVVTIADDDLPSVTIDGPSQVNENSGPYLITIKISNPAAETATVAWTTENGTATAGSDYTAQSGTVTFSGNVTQQIVTIALTGDSNKEDNETFKVKLSSPTNAELGETEFTGTIQNDDGLPTVEVIAPQAQNEGDAGGTPFIFTVKLSASSTETVTVVYNTANAIAQAGSDYTATSGTLTFAANTTELQQLITVLVTGDRLREDTNETFRIDLSSPSGATLKAGANTATATIVDDDPIPSLSISNPTDTEGDSGTKQFLFTVTLGNPSQQPVTVKYATQDGTAKANGDYTATSGTLTFAPNETSKVITVNVVGDLFNEENETFSVVLSSPSNASISAGTGTGTIQDEATDNVNIVPSTISGKVYVDNNGNGSQNGMEKALAGVQVNLTGTATMQTTTNADGTYTFANLEPGTYTVKFAISSQYKTGAAQIGSQGGTAVDGGYTFTIAAPGGVNGTNNHFATRGLKLEFLSQRQFIASELAGLNDLPAGQVNVAINTVTNPIGGANANNTTISGTGTPGALISVVASAGGTSTTAQTTTVAANGTWTVSGINVLTLPDGDVTYTVTATGSGTTDVDTIVSKKDTVAPALEIGSATDPINSGNQSDAAISGTGEVGASISVVVTDANGLSSTAVTATVGTGGTWSVGGINVSSLANGTLTYNVTAKDAAGNTTLKTKTATKDAEAPALAVTTIPTQIGPDTDNEVTIGGTASTGAVITVKVSDSTGQQEGPTTVTATDGTWSVDMDLSDLSAGTLTVTVVATDANNNTSSVTKIIQNVKSINVTVDAIEDPANAETADAFVLTGTTAANATVKITANDDNSATPATTVVTVQADGDGKWTATIDLTSLDDGDITFTVTANDTLGNTKTITAETTKDTEAPDLNADEVGPIGIANADEVPLAGSTEVGAVVTIVANDSDSTTPATAAVTATVDAEGDWTAEVDTTGLADGTITFTITARDAAGNVTTVTRTATKTTVTVNEIEGAINEDEDQDVGLSGTVAPGATVTVTANDNNNGTPATAPVTAVVDEQGNWTATLDVSGLDDGPITFTVTATLGGKSVSVTTIAQKDTEVALEVDPIDDPINAEDVGAFVVTGTVEVGSIVKVTAEDSGDGTTGPITATVDAQGHWTVTLNLSQLADGDITFTVEATDLAGNNAVSMEFSTLDTTAPDLGADEVDDINLGNADEVPLSGTIDAGATVTITANDGSDSTPATAPVTATIVGGAWTAAVDTTGLVDGTITFTITARDAAGNVTTLTRTATKSTVTVNDIEETINENDADEVALSGTVTPGATVTIVANDTSGTTPATAPVTAVVDAEGNWTATIDVSDLVDGTITFTVTATLDGKSGSASTEAQKDTAVELEVDAIDDPLNNAALEEFAASGSVEVGATVKVVAKDDGEGTTGDVSATVDAEGNWTAPLDLSELADGPITFTITATDAAGNVKVTTITVDKDTTIPELSVDDIVAIGISNAAEVPVAGTVSVGSTVTIVADDANSAKPATAVVNAIVDEEGNWTADIDVSGLDDGPITFTITATNEAGNTKQTTVVVQKDTVEPDLTANIPPIGLEEAEAAPASGTVEPGATVKIVANDDSEETPATGEVTAVVDAEGNWTANINVSGLNDGQITFTIVATDVGGNIKTLTVMADKDTIAPQLTAADVVAIGIENDDAVPLSGTVSSGSTVTIVAKDEDDSTPDTAAVTATLGEGDAWSAQLDVSNLSDGQITFVIRAVDEAGNVKEVTKTATKVTVSVNEIENGINADDASAVALSGKVEVGATVSIVADDDNEETPATDPVAAVVDAEGNWTATINTSALNDGAILFTVTATKGGKTAEATTTAAKDVVAPELAIDEVDAINGDNEESVTVSGTVTPGSTVKVVANDTNPGTEPTALITATVDEEGNWSASIDVSGLSDGTITFTVTANDAAGNETVDTVSAQKDVTVNPLAFADGAFSDDEDWLTFFE